MAFHYYAESCANPEGCQPQNNPRFDWKRHTEAGAFLTHYATVSRFGESLYVRASFPTRDPKEGLGICKIKA
jgi:hypothetical protein